MNRAVHMMTAWDTGVLASERDVLRVTKERWRDIAIHAYNSPRTRTLSPWNESMLGVC